MIALFMKNTFYPARAQARITALFGHGQIVTISLLVMLAVIVAMAELFLLHFAAPNRLTIAGGPTGNIFVRTGRALFCFAQESGSYAAQYLPQR